MDQEVVRQRFKTALDGLVRDVQRDRSVLAAILCGSLSHDTVWAKSDIDLVLVTVDHKKVELSDLALYADGVNVHTILIPRTEFRRTVEGSVHNSFMHSFLAKGQLLYTHDPTIAGLCSRLQSLGTRDAAVQMLRSAAGALSSIYKAHKWFVTRGDLDYTALWILYAATPIAEMEVIAAGLLVDREVIPRAVQLNPGLFEVIYLDLLNGPKSPERVRTALEAVDAYMAGRALTVFAPVVDYLREAAEVRSTAEIEHHFKKNFDVSGATLACEYLADQGLIGKASTPVHLTKMSNIEVQELAFFLPEGPDGS
jgi:hypothetical protein